MRGYHYDTVTERWVRDLPECHHHPVLRGAAAPLARGTASDLRSDLEQLADDVAELTRLSARLHARGLTALSESVYQICERHARIGAYAEKCLQALQASDARREAVRQAAQALAAARR